jgi:hypothetical protein
MTDKSQHRRVIATLSTTLLILLILLLISINRPAWLSTDLLPNVSILHLDEVDTYLRDEEMVIIEHNSAGSTTIETLPIDRVLFEYVEVVDGCGTHFEGECLNARSGPGIDHPAVAKLRNGMVLRISGKVDRIYDDGASETWYKVIFAEWLRYPQRMKTDWYVSADYVKILYDEGEKTTWDNGNASTTKYIKVDRAKQKLYAYEDDKLFLEADISTGRLMTPTPRGTFTVFKKTPSRYMQGPLPNVAGSSYYDLPGVPWNMYFTQGGAVIHGAYWHDSFGMPYSNGCVNLPPAIARVLYNWGELGMKVEVVN